MCKKKGQRGLVFLVFILVYSQSGTHTLTHIIANALSFWLSSPPICTQMQCNEGQPWSQLIKEANPQTLNELLFSPSSFLLLKCVKCRERARIKNPTWRHNPPLIQLESNLTTCVRRCSLAWGALPPPPWKCFFTLNTAACSGGLSRNRCEKRYNSFLCWQRRPGALLSWALGGGVI